MTNYKIVVANSALKSLKKIPKPYQKKITVAISSLATHPDPKQSKQLTHRPDRSLRVGIYRILYRIDKTVVTIYIVKIDHRKNVYK